MFPSYYRFVCGIALGCFIALACSPSLKAQVFIDQEVLANPYPEQSVDIPQAPGDETKQPVDLQADSLSHDEQNGIVTAAGEVQLVQAGRILRADEISYDLQKDEIVASGNVALNEANGDVHFADRVVLQDELKNGFIEGLRSYLVDGSRFKASQGERSDGLKTVMRDATYTPCKPCEKNPDGDPLWQIRASRVIHDEEEKEISYRHARFEVYGVPVAYTPYFSHPDPTVERRSGLLPPSIGYKSQLGTMVGTSYYWDIAPDQDATIGILAMTKENPLLFGEWRKGWSDARFEIDGSITYSEREDSTANAQRITQDAETRGHVFAQGIWNMSEKWRSGVNINYASDDQYLRQYDFSSEDVLESEIYAERFDGRHYGVIRALAFQDVRVDDFADQPDVLPEAYASFIGDPGSMPLIGGRWDVEVSALGLRRAGEKQDVNRLSMNTGWERRFVSDAGLVLNMDADLRGDYYNTRDRDEASFGSGISTQSNETRFFASLHNEASFPVARSFKKFQAVIEPQVAVTLAPNISVNDDIPNEDSQDVQLDASNLFEADRFPGLDRIEDQSRITYGIRNGIYGYNGSHADIFLGQSYRFDEDDNPFPEGSGLERQESDFVGQFSLGYKDILEMNYRFQMDSQDLASRRHEVDTYLDVGRFYMSSQYLFADALAETNIDESREQIRADAGYYLSDDWRLRSGVIQDLGETPGLREAYGGLDYFGDCISWSVDVERNLTDDETGDSSTEILFRIGLKNIGDYQRSGLNAVR